MRRLLLASIMFAGTLSLTGCFPFLVAGVGGSAAAANSASSPLSLGTQVDDTTIKTKAIGVLNSFDQLKQNNSNVEVVVFNRIILILGQVPTEKLKNDVATQLSEIERVRSVYNQLIIGPKVSLTQYAKDSWITTEIKAKMLGKVNPSSYKVVTENGIVYLMAVTTHADGEKAAQIASRVKGVRQVIEAYSYMKAEKAATIEEQ